MGKKMVVWMLSKEDADLLHEIISHHHSELVKKDVQFLPMEIWAQFDKYKNKVFWFMESLSEAMHDARQS